MAFVSQASGLTVAADTETTVYDATTYNSGNGAPADGAVLIGLVAANIGVLLPMFRSTKEPLQVQQEPTIFTSSKMLLSLWVVVWMLCLGKWF